MTQRKTEEDIYRKPELEDLRSECNLLIFEKRIAHEQDRLERLIALPTTTRRV